jgi:hypothetical protein
MTYEQWLVRVDEALKNMVGVGLDDFYDMPTRDMYDDGYHPNRAARKIVKLAQEY